MSEKMTIREILEEQLKSIEELCNTKVPKVFWENGIEQAELQINKIIEQEKITVEMVIKEDSSIYATSIPRNVILNIIDERKQEKEKMKVEVDNIALCEIILQTHHTKTCRQDISHKIAHVIVLRINEWAKVKEKHD